MIFQSLRLFFLAVSLVFYAEIAAAQQASQVKAADTSSPRDTLRSFLDACNELQNGANCWVRRVANLSLIVSDVSFVNDR